MSIADKIAIARQDLTDVYNAAKDIGYQQGTDYGFTWGYQDGYNNGDAYGYERGYSEGESNGYTNGYSEGETAGYDRGYAEGETQGFTTGYNNGYAEGDNAGYNRGYAEGSASATPTTPTDNRTSLSYWYSYLQDTWGRTVNWDTYEEVEYGEPLDEIAYPTGTQNVTNVNNFIGIYTFYEDMAGGYGQELRGLPTKKLTGVLDLPKITEVTSLFANARELEDAGTIVFGKPMTKVSNMFYGCSNFKNVKLVNFDTSDCEQFGYMFYSCQSIEETPTFDTRSGRDFNYMFGWCSSLVNIPSLNISNATAVSGMFYACSNLEHIGISGTISVALDLKSCTKLSHETLVAIINALVKKTSGTWKLTIGSTNIAKLSQDELNIATSKGWQVV